MSTNPLMHARNPYNTPLDLHDLSERYPVLSQYVHTKPNGKVIFDFKNRDALRCLTTILLKRDFGLDVTIPEDKLIPTLPLRLNYILWIEDLLEWSPVRHTECQTPIKGIDIGTGATCIYPLLMAKKNGWKVLGTEIDERSVQTARENVENNRLGHLVSVVPVPPSTFLRDVVNNEETFDFCMCNPPFFDRAASQTSDGSCKKNRVKRRRMAGKCISGSPHEISSPGGEEEFVGSIIRDSSKLRDRVKIYTAMIGCKGSLGAVLRMLEEYKVESFSTTQFCQGRTVRWAVAWTFARLSLKSNFSLSRRQRQSKLKSPSDPIGWTVECKYSLNESVDVLQSLLREFEIEFLEIERSERELAWRISACRNTWTGLRRKRREKLRNEILASGSSQVPRNDACKVPASSTGLSRESDRATSCNQFKEQKNILSDESTAPNCQKRQFDSATEVETHKKRKVSGENDGDSGPRCDDAVKETNEKGSGSSTVILEAVLRIRNLREDSDNKDVGGGIPLLLQISLIRGSAEMPQQILQFLKNNLV